MNRLIPLLVVISVAARGSRATSPGAGGEPAGQRTDAERAEAYEEHHRRSQQRPLPLDPNLDPIPVAAAAAP